MKDACWIQSTPARAASLAERPERRREQLLAWAAEMTHAG
jgi:hypothetical protein